MHPPVILSGTGRNLKFNVERLVLSERKKVICDLEIHEQRLLSFSVVSGLWISSLFPSTLPGLFLKPYLTGFLSSQNCHDYN